MQILALPEYIAHLGYTLSFDGSTYEARKSDGEVIGAFPNKEDALDFLGDFATAEAAALDDCSPITDEELASLALLYE